MSANVSIYQPNSLIIPQDMNLRRDNARPDNFIYKDYTEDYKKKYDNTTIFYDVFKAGNKIYLIGPPLLNLSDILQDCYAYDKEGRMTKVNIHTRPLDRTQISWIDIPEVTVEFERLRFDFSVFNRRLSNENQQFIFVEIGKGFNDILKDTKAAMAHQLNNRLEWISDWAIYYQRIHGVDTVVIYDNNSTSYSVQDIADSLHSIPGLKNIIVVKWNFKFGPQGKPWCGPDTPWDSDFCQIGSFQHMRYFFTLSAKGFISADIDELVIPLCGIDAFEALEHSEFGVVGFEGNTIERHISNHNIPYDIPRHYHFWERREDKSGGTIKWAGAPKKWSNDAISPTCHWVRNIKYDIDRRFSVGHFVRVNTGWKIKHRAEDGFEVNKPLRVDFALFSALKRAFPDKISDEIVADVLCNAENRIQAGDPNSIDFQSALRSGIILSTEKLVPWIKKWIYRENILVFEVMTPCMQIAFDVINSNNLIQINLAVRDVKYFDKFAQIVLKKDPSIQLLTNNKGFTIAKKTKSSFKSYEDAARYCSEILLDWYEVIK